MPDPADHPKLKVALVANAGGHLTELKLVEEAFAHCELLYVTQRNQWTQDRPDTQLIPVYVVGRFNRIRLAIYLLRLHVTFARLWFKHRPDCIVSTGAEVAVPAFWLGKLFGAKTIYIESATRYDSLGRAGRLVKPVTDRLFVQQASLAQAMHGEATFAGSVL